MWSGCTEKDYFIFFKELTCMKGDQTNIMRKITFNNNQNVLFRQQISLFLRKWDILYNKTEV